jgi:hypothetical protein
MTKLRGGSPHCAPPEQKGHLGTPEISGKSVQRPTRDRTQLRRDPIDRGLRSAVHDDAYALLRQSARDGEADPRGAAAHQRKFAFQTKLHGDLLSLPVAAAFSLHGATGFASAFPSFASGSLAAARVWL